MSPIEWPPTDYPPEDEARLLAAQRRQLTCLVCKTPMRGLTYEDYPRGKLCPPCSDTAQKGLQHLLDTGPLHAFDTWRNS